MSKQDLGSYVPFHGAWVATRLTCLGGIKHSLFHRLATASDCVGENPYSRGLHDVTMSWIAWLILQRDRLTSTVILLSFRVFFGCDVRLLSGPSHSPFTALFLATGISAAGNSTQMMIYDTPVISSFVLIEQREPRSR